MSVGTTRNPSAVDGSDTSTDSDLSTQLLCSVLWVVCLQGRSDALWRSEPYNMLTSKRSPCSRMSPCTLELTSAKQNTSQAFSRKRCWSAMNVLRHARHSCVKMRAKASVCLSSGYAAWLHWNTFLC